MPDDIAEDLFHGDVEICLYLERQIVCLPDFVEQSRDPFKVGKVGANLDAILMPVRNHLLSLIPATLKFGN